MKFPFRPAATTLRRCHRSLPVLSVLVLAAPLMAAEPEKKNDDSGPFQDIGLFTGFYEYDEPLENSDPKRGSHISGIQRLRMSDYYHAQSQDVRESSNGYVGLWASVPLGSESKKEEAKTSSSSKKSPAKPVITPRRTWFQTLMADEDVALHPFQGPPARSRNMRTVVVERNASDYVRKRPAPKTTAPTKTSSSSASKTPSKPAATPPAGGGLRGLFNGK